MVTLPECSMLEPGWKGVSVGTPGRPASGSPRIPRTQVCFFSAARQWGELCACRWALQGDRSLRTHVSLVLQLRAGGSHDVITTASPRRASARGDERQPRLVSFEPGDKRSFSH